MGDTYLQTPGYEPDELRWTLSILYRTFSSERNNTLMSEKIFRSAAEEELINILTRIALRIAVKKQTELTSEKRYEAKR